MSADEGVEIAKDFYPRPHMEGDPVFCRSLPLAPISTHALTWRATYESYVISADG